MIEVERPDGARVAAWVSGSGEGETVLLLHGLADDHSLWRHVAPSLAQRYRVVAVDLRGHGASAVRPLPPSMATYVGDVLAVADAVGAERFALVGLSMGGGIAQNVAMAAPERVAALGLLSTSSHFEDANRRRFRERADVAERQGMAAVVEATVPRWFAPAFREAHPEVVEATRRAVLQEDPAAFAAASRINADRDWTDRLATIRCPALYLAGLEDPADVRENARVLASALPDLEIHLLPGAAHLLPVEQPETVSALLVAFLDGVVGASSSRT